MLSPMILSIPAVVLPLMTAPPPDCQFGRLGDPAAEGRALAAFQAAVDDYVELHRRLERAWPPARFFSPAGEDDGAAETLRAALRDARPLAGPGGLFTPEVADVLRVRVAAALRNGEYERAVIAWPPDGVEDGARWKPAVNQPVPWGVSARRWPSLTMLPALPPELAYRFIGRDLILVDVQANLVVDMLELALPAAVAAPGGPPEMPPTGDDFEGCRPE